MNREREGLFLCLASAACFGAMAIFAKEATISESNSGCSK